VTSIPQLDKKTGKPESVLSIFNDITTSKKAEIELKEQKAFMQLVMDNTPPSSFSGKIQNRNIWVVIKTLHMRPALKIQAV